MTTTTDTRASLSRRHICAMAEWERHRNGWELEDDDRYYQRCPCCHQRVHVKDPDPPPDEWDPVDALHDAVEAKAGDLLDEAVFEHIEHECRDAWRVGQ